MVSGTRSAPELIKINSPTTNRSAHSAYRGELIAAGSFAQFDTVPANNIARWDGSSWSPLGVGVTGTVNALCVIGDTLYVGGLFAGAGGMTANNIAAWNGATWSALDDGLPQSNQGVKALLEFQGQLRAGGRFTAAGVANRSLATWDGSKWQGQSAISNIESMSVYGGALYATDGSTAVRKWNGTVWTNAGAIGQSLSNATKLSNYNGLLIAGGNFTSVRGITANSVAAFDGTKWSPIGSGIHNPHDGSDFAIRSIATFASKLIVAGSFISDSPLSRSIAQWDGAAWKALGAGICLPQSVQSGLSEQTPLVLAFSEWNGDFVMGGILANSATSTTSAIAIRHAGEWKPLGAGLTHTDDTPSVHAISSFRNQLVAAGMFNRSGSVAVNNIASWNGTQWSPLGIGVDGHVQDLAIFNGDLIAAGQFAAIGGSLNIARWDGVSWHPLAAGANNAIYALAVYQGELIAGGKFTFLGNVAAAHIARWDGVRWAPLGLGIDDPNGAVTALAVHNGELIAGGTFASAGGAPAKRVARWNGQTWSPLDLNYANSGVYSLAHHQGSLYAVGTFVVGDITAPFGLAKWDGSSWQPQAGTFDKPGQTLFSSDTELLIGGSFSRVDGQVSIAWARFGGCAFCPADLNGDSNVTDADFAIFTTAYDILDCSSPAMPANCASDFTHDGFVDDADFLTFISAYDAMACP